MCFILRFLLHYINLVIVGYDRVCVTFMDVA